MPKHKTTSKNLFEKIDANSVMVNKWAVLGVDANAIYCTLCRKPVPINHGGMEQVNQRVRGKTHKFFSDAKFSSSQSQFFKSASSIQLAKPVHIQVTQPEGLWAFKVAEQDWSFRSCDGIDRLFHRMFQSETSEKFTIGCTKMSYVVCHCLGPAILEEISKDIDASVGCIIQLLDETTTAQVKKQCDLLIRYWSEELDEVCTKYITSKMFGHTSAEHLMQLTLAVLVECSLPAEKFANITDVPNKQILAQKVRF